MRNWLGRLDLYLLSFLAAAIVAALLAELFLRVVSEPVLRPDRIAARSPSYRSAIFSRHVIRARERTVRHRKVSYKINANGYRGPPFEPDKPPGIIRIIVFGGSQVFEHSQQTAWPERVERLLKASGLERTEVINGGIPGHASFDSFGRLYAERTASGRISLFSATRGMT